MSNDTNKADIEAARIRNGLCPACGAIVKDKGSYIRCTECSWSLDNGTWDDEEGFAVDYGE